MTEKSEGKIIKVQHEKGFGFIISPEHKFVKFFFHWTGLVHNTKKFTELTAGMKVKFIPILENKEFKSSEAKESIQSRGPRAIQIEVI